MDLYEIGKILKQERERRGYSVEDVYKGTKISIMSIEALENGDFDVLPHPVYTRAFIKTYAEFLGLDPAEFLQAYDSFLNFSETEIEATQQLRTSVYSSRWLWLVLICFLLFIGACLLFYYFTQPSPSTLKESESEIEKMTKNTSLLLEKNTKNETKKENLSDQGSYLNASNATLNVSNATEVKYKEEATLNATGFEEKETNLKENGTIQEVEEANNTEEQNTNSQEKNKFIHEVKVIAKDRCWLKGEYDQNGTREAFLLKGQEIVFNFKNSLKIKFGNLGGVEIFFDGKKIEINGKKGQVKTLIFPPHD
jgi:cytoskeleton protein RodZ